jgi:di/tricarboxylate transporter
LFTLSAEVQTAIVLATLVGVMVAFASERFPADLVALATAGFLLVLGILDTDDLIGVFSNAGVITVGAMFVLSAALERTGCIEVVGAQVLRAARGDARRGLLMLTGVAVLTSAVINNTPVVVILIPIAIRLARELKLAPSKLLIPVSYAAMVGGTCTLIGTSTNLLVDGVAQQNGQPAFGIFEITPFGLCYAVIGLAYLYSVGWRLLPSRESMADMLAGQPQRRFLIEVLVPAGSEFIGRSLKDAKLRDLPDARLIDVVRADDSLRRRLDGVILEAGDRLLFRSAMAGIMTLREQSGLAFELGTDLEEISERATVLVEGIVGPRSPLLGARLIDLRVRRRYGVYVLAVHRQGVNLRERFEQVQLEVGDTLLVEGTPESIRSFVDSGALINLTQPQERPMRRDRAWVALGAVAAVVGLAALNVMPIAGLAVVAAVVVVLAGCLQRDELYQAIEWPILFLIFGMLAVGRAMDNTGAVALVVDAVVGLIGPFGPLAVLSLIYFASMLLTEIVSNNAVGVLLTPIAIGLADSMGVDARPFIVAVMFAASASFATPIGYQTNTIVYGAGGYRYLDFVKVGLPLNLILWLVATALLPVFFPL